MDGTKRPGGTTLLGAIMAPSSMMAPSKMTELYPMNARYFKIQEYNVHPFCTTQSSCIYKWALKPEEEEAAVCRTQLLPMLTFVWILNL